MAPILNHIISFADVPDIDRYLQRYKKAGFVVDPQTVRHAPGRRNGFVHFGPEYIEFFWIEDQKEFNKKGKAYHQFFQHHPRPFGIAWESKGVDAFHKSAIRKGYKLAPTWSKAMKEAKDDKPWWAFQNVPQIYLPGVWSFMLTYLRRDWSKPFKAKTGANTIYGLTGITFITTHPNKRALVWQKFLGGRIRKPAHLILGPHTLEWITEKEYEKQYGAIHSPLAVKFKNMQGIALIHLIASDIKKAKRMLDRNGFKTSVFKRGFFITPDKRDGFAFSVTQQNPKKWAQSRSKYRKVVFV